MRSLLTKTQREALRCLEEHGGEGAVIEKNGHVLAAGCILGAYNEREDETGTQYMPYSRQTWAGLREHGMIESAGTGRIRLSRRGEDFA